MSSKSPLEKKNFDLKKRSASSIMKHRIADSIIAVNKASRIRQPLENPLPPSNKECYFNYNNGGGMMPIDAEYFRKLAVEWKQVATDTEMLVINEYPLSKGFSLTTFGEWISRSDELKEAQTMVRAIIAIRRERGAMKNEYNSRMVEKMQHYYDPAWRESEEWRASLAAKNQMSVQQPITVVLEAFPNSNLVPKKEES